MIRSQTLNEIRDALGSTQWFEADDFTVTVGTAQGSGRPLISIQYRFDSSFSFIASFPTSTDSDEKIRFTARPGQVVQAETSTVSSGSMVLSYIKDWVQRVHVELLAIPVYRESQANKDKLEEVLGRLEEIPDEYFTKVEATQVSERLDALEKKLADALRGAAENEKSAKKKIDDLHSDVERLKQGMGSLKKKGWAGSFMVRVARWMKDPANRDLLESGVEVARTIMLPGHPPQP